MSGVSEEKAPLGALGATVMLLGSAVIALPAVAIIGLFAVETESGFGLYDPSTGTDPVMAAGLGLATVPLGFALLLALGGGVAFVFSLRSTWSRAELLLPWSALACALALGLTRILFAFIEAEEAQWEGYPPYGYVAPYPEALRWLTWLASLFGLLLLAASIYAFARRRRPRAASASQPTPSAAQLAAGAGVDGWKPPPEDITSRPLR